MLKFFLAASAVALIQSLRAIDDATNHVDAEKSVSFAWLLAFLFLALMCNELRKQRTSGATNGFEHWNNFRSSIKLDDLRKSIQRDYEQLAQCEAEGKFEQAGRLKGLIAKHESKLRQMGA